MSTIAKGAQRVGSAMTQLHRAGYRCARVSSSGQRKGKRRAEGGIPGDVIALAPVDSGLPHVIVEVGGIGKRLAVSFAELTEAPLPPGFTALVARCVNRKWLWYSDPDSRHPDLLEALDALRA